MMARTNGPARHLRRFGFDPLTHNESQQSVHTFGAERPQLSRFSTATLGPEEPGIHEEDETEHQEVVLPEVKVSEIESHLAAVEAALQDNRAEEASILLLCDRECRMRLTLCMPIHLRPACFPERAACNRRRITVEASTEDLALPGSWTQDTSSFIMSDDGRRITLAPESHEALADAVRSVRRAISSSQLTENDGSGTAIANHSVETLGMESFVSEVAEPVSERAPVGDVSVLSEATPARAARRRQEGMRDIEEAYSRMLALVQSSAIGVTPSPQMKSDDSRLGAEPPRRPIKHGLATSGGNEPFFNSPLAKSSTKTDEPLYQETQSKRNTYDGAAFAQASRSQPRSQTHSENRTSTSLSGLMGMPTDINPHMLRMPASLPSHRRMTPRGTSQQKVLEFDDDRRRMPSRVQVDTRKHLAETTTPRLPS